MGGRPVEDLRAPAPTARMPYGLDSLTHALSPRGAAAASGGQYAPLQSGPFQRSVSWIRNDDGTCQPVMDAPALQAPPQPQPAMDAPALQAPPQPPMHPSLTPDGPRDADGATPAGAASAIAEMEANHKAAVAAAKAAAAAEKKKAEAAAKAAAGTATTKAKAAAGKATTKSGAKKRAMTKLLDVSVELAKNDSEDDASTSEKESAGAEAPTGAKKKKGSGEPMLKSEKGVPKAASVPAKGGGKLKSKGSSKGSVAAATPKVVFKKPAKLCAPVAGKPLLYQGGKVSFSESKKAWRVWPDASVVAVEKAFTFGDDAHSSFVSAIAFLDNHGVDVRKG